MAEEEGFVEVSNEVPFRSIEAILVEEVKLSDEKYHIYCRRAFNGHSLEQEATLLVRTHADLQWLLAALAALPCLPLLPKLDSSSLLALLLAQPALHAKYECSLRAKVVGRFLRLATTLVVAHLKAVEEQCLQPLFIFFHENFTLYQNPIYFKSQSRPLSRVVGDYFWGKFAALTSRPAASEEVQKARAEVGAEREKLEGVRGRLGEYVGCLGRLQEEFMGERDHIRGKWNKCQELLLSYDNLVKYLLLVDEEVAETLARVEDRAAVEGLLQMYGKELQSEREAARKAGEQLMHEYVRVVCQEEIAISVAPH
jgi:hypothetical protein